MTAPRAVRPARNAPSATALHDLQRWAELRSGALARAQKSADTWRNGLAGFVTLLLSVLILKGSALTDVTGWARWAIALCFIGGAGCAIAGLWRALIAQVPNESRVDYDDVIAKHGSIATYELELAALSQCRIKQAQRFVMVALGALIVGMFVWWVAPGPTPSPRVHVTWSDQGAVRKICGELLPAPDRRITVRANSQSDPMTIPVTKILQLDAVPSCS